MLKLEIPMDRARPWSTSCSSARTLARYASCRITHLLHLLPGGVHIVGELNIELLLAVLSLDDVVKGGDNTGRGIDLEVDLTMSARCMIDVAITPARAELAAHVPVHQVQVKVLEAELGQGVLDGELDVFRVVVELKELGGDKDLLSGDTGLLDTLTNFGLVSVRPSAAEGSAAEHSIACNCSHIATRNSLDVSVAVLIKSARAPKRSDTDDSPSKRAQQP